MKAKDFLKRLQWLNKRIENKLEEKKHMRAIAYGTAVRMDSERVQTSGSKDRLGDIVATYVDIEAEINQAIDQLYNARQDIIGVIEKLEDATEYDLIHKMYVGKIVFKDSDNEDDAIFEIQCYDLYDIARLYQKTYSWATTIHGRALKNVQRILDEREKQCQK